ncbi:MAG: Ribose 1,5-bisphosphate isomerase [Methanosaeta sp. PtaU1.Bin028]|nr:MAG: Ribose 1,5-bisphosphate isomerase [Methanosaeta sp. PtaU1.Bin028]
MPFQRGQIGMSIETTAEKIRTMQIRGAGLIARQAALALKEFALVVPASSIEEFNSRMAEAGEMLLHTRPTAVSLGNAVRMVVRHKESDLDVARAAVAKNADEFVESSLQAVGRIGEIGSRRVQSGDCILTHCNSSAALSVIEKAHLEGKGIHVIATESRPRYQGHLTIKRLDDLGIDAQMIVDSAVRTVMNEVDLVVVGADVITASGSLVNKIGTSQIALSAHEARTPFMVAAETYKFSPETLAGAPVVIEERGPEEVYPAYRELRSVRIRNPAFDVTPHHYIDVICTEVGAIPPEMSYLIIKERLGWQLSDSL